MDFLNDIWCFFVKHDEMVRGYLLILVAGFGLRLTFRRLALADANHLADTYTRAIDQIGQNDQVVRLGGLYALGELAHKNKDYHWKIMKVLCAFVRENASPIGGHPLPITIQAALTIIAERRIDFDRQQDTKNNTTIDLSKSCLQGAHLEKADLDDADVSYADLRESNITQEQFYSAITNKDTIPPLGIKNPDASPDPSPSSE